jgi:C-terminal peptidase prc
MFIINCKNPPPTGAVNEIPSEMALAQDINLAGPKASTEELRWEYYSVYQLYKSYFIWSDSLKKASDYKNLADLYINGIYTIDEYSGYIAPTASEEVWTSFETPQKAEGRIGILFEDIENATDSIPDTLQLAFVYRDSPADSNGWKRGDQIIAIQAVDSASLFPLVGLGSPLAIFNELSQGFSGDTIYLQLYREDSLWLDTLIKAPITEPTVIHYNINDSTSYIQVKSFRSTSDDFAQWQTSNEFLYALEQTQETQSSIIDLRDNPGGTVIECARMSDFFLTKGQVIFKTESKSLSSVDNKSIYTTTLASDTLPTQNRQYVFLANTNSASCSEIFLNAIAFNTDWPIVGETTFGKGIGQSFYTTYLRGIAKLTTLVFFNGDFETFHLKGVPPTHKVAGEKAQFAKALSLLGSNQPARLLPRVFLKTQTEIKEQEHQAVKLFRDSSHFAIP